jgi:hypothetical protein
MTDVSFEVEGQCVVLSEAEAIAVAEKLRGYSAGLHPEDLEELQRTGMESEWVGGARAMADAIEDVLTDTSEGPIPLDRQGLAAAALLAVLCLTPITFADTTTPYARLYELLGPSPATDAGRRAA